MHDFTEHDDRWLREALHSVSPPGDLRERIRSRLRQEATAQLPAPQPAGSDAASTVPASTVPAISGRRAWLAWVLAAATAAAVLMAVRWSQPLSPQQLAAHCLVQLDGVLQESHRWQSDVASHISQLSVLEGRLQGQVQPLGYLDLDGGRFAKRCRVWKLRSDTTQRVFYVFDFQDARSIGRLGGQFQAVDRVSGGWSLYAMRSSERVLVVLFEGRVDDYLHRLQSA